MKDKRIKKWWLIRLALTIVYGKEHHFQEILAAQAPDENRHAMFKELVK